jgi:hypothetical protein
LKNARQEHGHYKWFYHSVLTDDMIL